jgi:hypothetical protein
MKLMVSDNGINHSNVNAEIRKKDGVLQLALVSANYFEFRYSGILVRYLIQIIGMLRRMVM